MDSHAPALERELANRDAIIASLSAQLMQQRKQQASAFAEVDEYRKRNERLERDFGEALKEALAPHLRDVRLAEERLHDRDVFVKSLSDEVAEKNATIDLLAAQATTAIQALEAHSNIRHSEANVQTDSMAHNDWVERSFVQPRVRDAVAAAQQIAIAQLAESHRSSEDQLGPLRETIAMQHLKIDEQRREIEVLQEQLRVRTDERDAKASQMEAIAERENAKRPTDATTFTVPSVFDEWVDKKYVGPAVRKTERAEREHAEAEAFREEALRSARAVLIEAEAQRRSEIMVEYFAGLLGQRSMSVVVSEVAAPRVATAAAAHTPPPSAAVTGLNSILSPPRATGEPWSPSPRRGVSLGTPANDAVARSSLSVVAVGSSIFDSEFESGVLGSIRSEYETQLRSQERCYEIAIAENSHLAERHRAILRATTDLVTEENELRSRMMLDELGEKYAMFDDFIQKQRQAGLEGAVKMLISDNEKLMAFSSEEVFFRFSLVKKHALMEADLKAEAYRRAVDAVLEGEEMQRRAIVGAQAACAVVFAESALVFNHVSKQVWAALTVGTEALDGATSLAHSLAFQHADAFTSFVGTGSGVLRVAHDATTAMFTMERSALSLQEEHERITFIASQEATQRNQLVATCKADARAMRIMSMEATMWESYAMTLLDEEEERGRRAVEAAADWGLSVALRQHERDNAKLHLAGEELIARFTFLAIVELSDVERFERQRLEIEASEWGRSITTAELSDRRVVRQAEDASKERLWAEFGHLELLETADRRAIAEAEDRERVDFRRARSLVSSSWSQMQERDSEVTQVVAQSMVDAHERQWRHGLNVARELALGYESWLHQSIAAVQQADLLVTEWAPARVETALSCHPLLHASTIWRGLVEGVIGVERGQGDRAVKQLEQAHELQRLIEAETLARELVVVESQSALGVLEGSIDAAISRADLRHRFSLKIESQQLAVDEMADTMITELAKMSECQRLATEAAGEGMLESYSALWATGWDHHQALVATANQALCADMNAVIRTQVSLLATRERQEMEAAAAAEKAFLYQCESDGLKRIFEMFGEEFLFGSGFTSRATTPQMTLTPMVPALEPLEQPQNPPTPSVTPAAMNREPFSPMVPTTTEGPPTPTSSRGGSEQRGREDVWLTPRGGSVASSVAASPTQPLTPSSAATQAHLPRSGADSPRVGRQRRPSVAEIDAFFSPGGPIPRGLTPSPERVPARARAMSARSGRSLIAPSPSPPRRVGEGILPDSLSSPATPSKHSPAASASVEYPRSTQPVSRPRPLGSSFSTTKSRPSPPRRVDSMSKLNASADDVVSLFGGGDDDDDDINAVI